jgi:hypothetical protein
MVLHHAFFDDKVTFLNFEQIRAAIKTQPANAINLELLRLVNSGDVQQRTETRQRTGLAGMSLQGAAPYEVPVDGYKLSRSGIIKIESFDDSYYAKLQNVLGLDETTAVENDPQEMQWEPLPLDRTDSKQQAANEALDNVVEELRQDNGYAATNPEEKAFVQDKLVAVTKRLKEDTHISWMYLREFAFKPLGIVIKRFGGAAIGIAAVAARESLVSWLKSKGISFLDDIVK